MKREKVLCYSCLQRFSDEIVLHKHSKNYSLTKFEDYFRKLISHFIPHADTKTIPKRVVLNILRGLVKEDVDDMKRLYPVI